MQVTVKLSNQAYQQFINKTLQLGTQAAQELARGLNEGGDKVQTQVRRALKVQTGVSKYGTIVQNTTNSRAFAGHLSYSIRSTGHGLPITDFPYSVPGHVQASPWGVTRQFARSFKQLVKGGLKARLTSKRFPLRSLYGPSIPKELVKDKSKDAFETGTVFVREAVEKRLARLMP